jgi:hypothetical protein
MDVAPGNHYHDRVARGKIMQDACQPTNLLNSPITGSAARCSQGGSEPFGARNARTNGRNPPLQQTDREDNCAGWVAGSACGAELQIRLACCEVGG